MVLPDHRPRAPGRTDRLLALTAEVSLAVQLITRHRAPRVAGAVAFAVALVASLGSWWVGHAMPPVPGALNRSLSAAVAAVIGARLLAPGAALHAARYAAVSAGTVVLGRACGALLLAGPLGLAAAFVSHGSAPAAAVVLTCVATMALAMATAPVAGAFLSGVVWAGVGMVWAFALDRFEGPWVLAAATLGAVAGLLLARSLVSRGRVGHRPVR